MPVPPFLRDLVTTDRAWVQGGLFAVLLLGAAIVAWLLRTQNTEFIYSLF